jgi:hypothetical protein
MHVFEVPHIVLGRLSESTENVNVRGFVKETWPNTPERELRDWSDKPTTIGKVGQFALRLDESDMEAALSLHRDKASAMVNTQSNSLGTLSAARYGTGIWVYGKGSQSTETIGFLMRHSLFGVEGFNQAKETLKILGRMIEVTEEILASTPVEGSTFFEHEINISSFPE